MGLDIAVATFCGFVVLVMVTGCLLTLLQKKCPQLLPRQLQCPPQRQARSVENNEDKKKAPSAG